MALTDKQTRIDNFLNADIEPESSPIPLSDFNKESNLVHLFDPQSIYALTAAYHSGRPLLVRGDPGTGKSQLARAAAEALGWQFVSTVITAHTEVQDLWYHFDTVNRLGRAQLMSAMYSNITDDRKKIAKLDEGLNPKKYLSPGVLWWAYDWVSAVKQCQQSEHRQYVPERVHELKDEFSGTAFSDLPKDIQQPDGVVLLIDEIDKSDADLPNSLLETLDCKSFDVPWVNESVGNREKNKDQLVIITTNEERQLPPAFLRRCLVLNCDLPKDDDKLTPFLIKRAEAHFKDSQLTARTMKLAAEQLIKDRQLSLTHGYKPPGQAEYLDMLRVLKEFDPERQITMLGRIQDFALKKHPELIDSEDCE